MKLVFLGSGVFGLASLRALIAAGFVPQLVVSQPPRRRRRGKPPEPTPVHAEAERAGIAVITPEKANASLDELHAACADLFVVAEFGQILSEALLQIPPLGAINVHSSLLPRHRGASPIAAAILAGDTETGVSIQRVVKALDAGPVLAERRLAIEARETAGELTERLAPLGGELIVDVVRAFADGSPPPERPQDEAFVTSCRRLTREDAAIDWARPAAELDRLVRAMTPSPGVRTEIARDPPLQVTLRKAQAVEGEHEPGVVAWVGRGGFGIGTGDGTLEVQELVPASKKAMPGTVFANGYQLKAGERFR